MKLSEREGAALLALAASEVSLSGIALAAALREHGVRTNSYGAHQSAGGLVRKELAARVAVAGEAGPLIGYELTSAGRTAAAGLRGAP